MEEGAQKWKVRLPKHWPWIPQQVGELWTINWIQCQLTLFQRTALYPTREWRLSSFEMGRPLGKGKFGRVYMVRTKTEPHYIVALKCLYKSEIVESGVEKQIRREIEIQQNLRYDPRSGMRFH